MRPRDLKAIEELKERSTQVVGWYPHSQHDGYHLGRASVRGPFGRWLMVEGGKGYEHEVADLYDDAKYAACAMNNTPALLAEVRRLRRELASEKLRVREAMRALKFYAKEDNYEDKYFEVQSLNPTISKWGYESTEVQQDFGVFAREALSRLRGKRGGG